MAKKSVKQRTGSAKQKKALQRDTYLKMMKNSKPFSMPETDKKIVVSLGHNSASKGRITKQFGPVETLHEIRVDTSSKVEPDIQTELWNINEIPDGSVDAVWIGYILQRFTYEHATAIITEALRVMKDGAEILVAVPDMQIAANYIARDESDAELYHSPAGAITPRDVMFGFHKFINAGDLSALHKSGYTTEILSHTMREAGICNMRVKRNQFDILALGKKLPYEHPDRVDRVVMIKNDDDRPKAPNAPQQRANIAKPVRYADTMDVEPQIWKPLGLQKTKK